MRRKALIDSVLSYVASIYYEAHARTDDHRGAFVETVRKALQEGFQPHAAWATDAMLASSRPTHAVQLSHPEASMAFPVIVGGVSIGWADQLLESEPYTPESGRGWRLIKGKVLDLYMRWARQVPEPPQIELDFRRGMGR